MNIGNIPIEQRRGIEYIDLNDTIILVKAPIESVEPAFSSSRQADLWQRDVYKREIEIIGHSFIIFQFRGQAWTLIQWLYVKSHGKTITPEDAQTLSNLLYTRAIYYKISDTGGTLEYQIYDDGTLMEKLVHEEEISTEFQSQLRSLKAEDIQRPYGFVYNLVVEQNTYIPMRFAKQYYEVGGRITLELEEIEHENLERMDYIAPR
ncbi:MAG: hypothetical protein KME08_03835 [Aphanothece sp. CMT-3BRIN-NPC111]|jgi:hypothetical protein|nr:hypothetical protein [Aphanothece sp. CMT-3BRIN-NPC111]